MRQVGMDDGARGWLVKAASKHYWRVSRWIDFDDLIQEGHWVWASMLQRYPTATDAPHRMALFKRMFLSRITDLANKRTRSPDEICISDMFSGEGDVSPVRADVFLESIAAPADLRLALPSLLNAPQYVQDALALFTTAQGLRRLRSRPRRVVGVRRRESLNETLCRLTGCDPQQVDIVGALRACLEQE